MLNSINFQVVANGKDVSNTINQNLESISITDKSGLEADSATIKILDAKNQFKLPKMGVELSIYLGKGGENLHFMGKFTVDQINEQLSKKEVPVITVTSHSADFTKAIKSTKDANFKEKTIDSIVKNIAAQHGMTAQVHSTLAGITLNHINQRNESDANLLTRLAEEFDAIAAIKNGKLIFLPHASGTSASGTGLAAVNINLNELGAYSFDIKEREGSYTGVIAKWRNIEENKTIKELAGTAEQIKILKKTYPTKQEAKAAAKGEWQRLSRSQHTLSLTHKTGLLEAFAGQPATLSGFRSEIENQKWSIKTLTHTIDKKNGLSSQFELEELFSRKA